MFWSRSQSFDPLSDALSNLTGKVIIVTGANTGIGYTTAKHLARKGAKVYVGARSEEKGKQAIEKLQEEGVGSGEVVFFLCDLSTPALAKKSAEAFLQLEQRLDVLVNNAACIYDTPDKPAQDGITEMMMVNHIGTFQLTITLLPLLIETSEEPNSDVRIVTVSSRAHTLSRALNKDIRFDTLHEFKSFYEEDRVQFFSRYSISKLANVLFSNTLQRRLSSTNIICISLHPGRIYTSIAQRMSFPRPLAFLLSLLLMHPDEGALTSCFAAASPRVRKEPDTYKGAYLVPVGAIGEPAPNTRNVALQDELWETTEKYLGTLDL